MGTTAGLAITAYGASQSASANRSAGNAQQAVANYNASISGLQAEDAIARGREDETRLRVRARVDAGEVRARYAAAGIDISDVDSSFAELQASNATLAEVDAMTIRTNAAREAWGYRAQAENQRAGGEIARKAGNQKAIGSIVSGVKGLYGAGAFSGYGYGITAKPRAQNLGYAFGALPQE